MMCCMCIQPTEFHCEKWIELKEHFKKKHPEIANPGVFYTKEAKLKNV